MTLPLFNVETSFMQARWMLAPADEEATARIVQKHNVPEIVARLLAARDVAPEQVESYLFPRLSRDFPDPFALTGMTEAAGFIAEAIGKGQKIGLFADFDVDGATSAGIFLRFMRHLGAADTPFHIPDRITEGYGPNIEALQKLKNKGAEIVVICDCGITAFDVIAAGRDMGLDIIVLDHHEAEDTLPDATHVINPKRKDDDSGYDMLAACGVTFLFCVAINAKLRENGFFADKGIEEPPLKDSLDLVALGTVCDMVPLTGPNRLFVRSGFECMNRRENAGIRALCDVSKTEGELTPTHAGFTLGPRINAGSRVHRADLGAQLLSTDDPAEAVSLAWTLEDCNKQRRAIQAEMLKQAVQMVEADGLDEHPVIVVGHENWHPGLSGLVAGRLKEKYGKPAVAITYAQAENGTLEGRGSGRSVPGVNMGAAFIAARNEDLLVKGGGHAMAAGFTILPEQLEPFRSFLQSHVEKQIAGDADLAIETVVDAILSVRGAQVDMVRLLHDHIGPFGQAHAEPLFVLPSVRLHRVATMGKSGDHIQAMVSDWEGGPRLRAVSFGNADTPMGEALLKYGEDRPFHLAGHLKHSTWNGQERVEMHIQDAAFADVMEQREAV